MDYKNHGQYLGSPLPLSYWDVNVSTRDLDMIFGLIHFPPTDEELIKGSGNPALINEPNFKWTPSEH